MVLRAKQGTSIFMPQPLRANTPCFHHLVCLDRLFYPGALQRHQPSSALCLSPLSCSGSLLTSTHSFQLLHCELAHVLSKTYVVSFYFNVCVCVSGRGSTKVKHRSFSLAHTKHGTLKELNLTKSMISRELYVKACIEWELEHET